MDRIWNPTILVNILNKLDYWDLESAYHVCTMWRDIINKYKLWQKQMEDFIQMAEDSKLDIVDYLKCIKNTTWCRKSPIYIVAKLRNIYFTGRNRKKYMTLATPQVIFKLCVLTQFEKQTNVTYYNLNENVVQSNLSLYTVYTFLNQYVKTVYVIHYMIFEISKRHLRKMFQEFHTSKIVIVPIISYLVRLHQLYYGIVICTMFNKITIVGIVLHNKVLQYKKIFHSTNDSPTKITKNNKKDGYEVYNDVPQIIQQLLMEFSPALHSTLLEVVLLIGFKDFNILTKVKRAFLKQFASFLPNISFEDIFLEPLINNCTIEMKEILSTIDRQDCYTEFTTVEPFSCTIIDYLNGQLDDENEPYQCYNEAKDDSLFQYQIRLSS